MHHDHYDIYHEILLMSKTRCCVWVLRRHVYRDTGVKLLTAQRVTLDITICHSAAARAHHYHNNSRSPVRQHRQVQDQVQVQVQDQVQDQEDVKDTLL